MPPQLASFDQSCAAAVPQSLPAAIAFPTPDQFAAYSQAADAIFKAALSVQQEYHGAGSATMNDLTLSIETAGGAFYDASQLAEGDPGAAQDDTRATTYLGGAEVDASDLHLAACEHAMKRIGQASSGSGG